MINKDEIAIIYSDFFEAATKNPLIILDKACEALDLSEDEAMKVIKDYLFSYTSKMFDDENQILLTNQTGFKLLHIYAIEKENALNIFTDRFLINSEQGNLNLPREEFIELIDQKLKGEN